MRITTRTVGAAVTIAWWSIAIGLIIAGLVAGGAL